MTAFRDLPIQRRLSLVIVAVCALVTVLASTTIGAFMVLSYRRAMVRNATVWADLLGTNAEAAVAFADEVAIANLLHALRHEATVTSARVYGPDGMRLAGYVADGQSDRLPQQAPLLGHRFTASDLIVARPIARGGKRLGTIAIEVDLAGLYALIWVSVAVVAAVSVASIVLAYLLSSWLQRPISQPIVELAVIAREVAQRRDYSVRAPPGGRDEIGTLTQVFNHMLDALGERAADLQRSNQELEQFAYIAAHDLQEPVRMIASYLQLLEKRLAPHFDARTRQYFDYASTGAMRMSEMIRSLLVYSRIGRDSDRREPVRLGTVLDQARDNLRLEIERVGATVLAGRLPAVIGDETQLMRLMQNLIANALKFRRDQAPRVEITGRRQGEQVEVRVADNGIGIDPEDGKRLFTLFARLHRVGAYPGTGLGLASCKKIVDRHGGRIWFEPNPGGGTVFVFTLPGAPDA